ncbi:hypothetical protein [Desulfogranum marinum]|uniref:hypothetical protein n=1 Tax=Desulfogranum marinum TaxID=453220 RepID=UPI0029C8F6DE|nr:hypothetical protein [Desulfogranum marinum]
MGLGKCSLNSLAKLYYQFEAETAIAKFFCRGIPVWEILRFPLFQLLCNKAGVLDLGHAATPRTLGNCLRSCRNIVNSRFSSALRLPKQSDCLILGHPRLIKNQQGHYEDPYSELYFNNSGYSTCFVERAFQGTHLIPRSPGYRYKYDDIVFKANRSRATLSILEKASFLEFEKTFYSITGFSVDIVGATRRALGRREVLLPYFEKLLKKIKPKLGVVVIAYQCPEFIEACRMFGIPVLEIQHGVISNYHFGYHQNVSMPTLYYPDHLWLWGGYWKSSATFADKINLDVVGFSLFERYRHLQTKKKQSKCIFISQGSIGRKISEKAIELRKKKPDLEIYYKLHPSEFDDWEEKYKDLCRNRITILGRNDGSLYDWLGRMHFVVGAYSTALFEAACLGCRVGVLDLPGVEYMQPLISQGGAYALRKGFSGFFSCEGPFVFDENSIFEPYSEQNVVSMLNKYMSR